MKYLIAAILVVSASTSAFADDQIVDTFKVTQAKILDVAYSASDITDKILFSVKIEITDPKKKVLETLEQVESAQWGERVRGAGYSWITGDNPKCKSQSDGSFICEGRLNQSNGKSYIDGLRIVWKWKSPSGKENFGVGILDNRQNQLLQLPDIDVDQKLIDPVTGRPYGYQCEIDDGRIIHRNTPDSSPGVSINKHPQAATPESLGTRLFLSSNPENSPDFIIRGVGFSTRIVMKIPFGKMPATTYGIGQVFAGMNPNVKCDWFTDLSEAPQFPPKSRPGQNKERIPTTPPANIPRCEITLESNLPRQWRISDEQLKNKLAWLGYKVVVDPPSSEETSARRLDRINVLGVAAWDSAHGDANCPPPNVYVGKCSLAVSLDRQGLAPVRTNKSDFVCSKDGSELDDFLANGCDLDRALRALPTCRL